MFPCEMARYIAGFQPEARKYGRFLRPSEPRDLGPRRPDPGVPTGRNRQHFAAFGGHFRAAAAGGAARGGGAAIRGGAGGGAATRTGGGGATALGGGGAAALGGGDGEAMRAGGG